MARLGLHLVAINCTCSHRELHCFNICNLWKFEWPYLLSSLSFLWSVCTIISLAIKFIKQNPYDYICIYKKVAHGPHIWKLCKNVALLDLILFGTLFPTIIFKRFIKRTFGLWDIAFWKYEKIHCKWRDGRERWEKCERGEMLLLGEWWEERCYCTPPRCCLLL